MNPRLHQSFLLFFLIHASCVTANIATHRRVRSIKGESRMNRGEGVKTANRNEAGWERSTNGKLRSLGEKDDEKGKKGKEESSDSTDIVDGKKTAMKGEGKSSGKGMASGKGKHKSPEKEVMTKKPKAGKEKGKGKKSAVEVKEKKEKIGKQTDGVMQGKVEVSPKEASKKAPATSKVMRDKKEKKEVLHKETDDMLWKEVSDPSSPPEPVVTESPVVVPDPPAPSPTDSPTEAIIAETEQPVVQPVMTDSPVESPSASPDETDVPTCLECDDPNVN
jgi:hypothetical protein